MENVGKLVLDYLITCYSELLDENEKLYKRRGEAIGAGLKYREENWLLKDALKCAADRVEYHTGSCPADSHEEYARLLLDDCEANCGSKNPVDCWVEYFKYLSSKDCSEKKTIPPDEHLDPMVNNCNEMSKLESSKDKLNTIKERIKEKGFDEKVYFKHLPCIARNWSKPVDEIVKLIKEEVKNE